MEKQQIFDLLQEMGYKVSFDKDGDIMVTYQLKHLYLLVSQDNDNFASLLLPQFHSIEDNEENLVLAACNKMTRDVKMVKVFVDYTFKSVSATCEFFYTDEESMRRNITHALQIIGGARSMFYSTLRELRECLDSGD